MLPLQKHWLDPYWVSIRNELGHLHPCKTRSAHSIIENRCVGQTTTFSIMNTLHFNRPWLSFSWPKIWLTPKKWNKFDKVYWFDIKSHTLSLLSDIVETAVKKNDKISLPSSVILVRFKVQCYDIESHILPLLRDIGETAWGTSGFPRDLMSGNDYFGFHSFQIILIVRGLIFI